MTKASGGKDSTVPKKEMELFRRVNQRTSSVVVHKPPNIVARGRRDSPPTRQIFMSGWSSVFHVRFSNMFYLVVHFCNSHLCQHVHFSNFHVYIVSQL